MSLKELFVLSTFVFLLYSFSLHSEFVNIDDPSYVYLNKAIAEKSFSKALTSITVGDWTPLVTISHIVENTFNQKISSFNAHFVSILLHLINAILVYYLVSFFRLEKKISLLIALIFLAHPLQVESVSWIASRKNLLSTFFGLSFCLLALKNYFKSAILFLIFSLMSKGVAVIFAPWYLLLAILEKKNFHKEKYFIIISFILALLRGLLSVGLQKEVIAAREVAKMAFFQRFNIFTQVLAVQIRQFFLPYDLCLRYSWKTDFGMQFYVALLLLAILFFTCFYLKKRELNIALALFFVTLFPTSNLISAPDFQADRYFYLAIFPFSIFVFLLINKLNSKILYLFYLWLVLLLPYNIARQKTWQNSANLWQDVLQKYPNYSFGWNQLSLFYLSKKNIPQAEIALRKTLQLEPSNIYAKYNLGLLLKNTNRKHEAKQYLKSLTGTEVENKFPLKRIISELDTL